MTVSATKIGALVRTASAIASLGRESTSTACRPRRQQYVAVPCAARATRVRIAQLPLQHQPERLDRHSQLHLYLIDPHPYLFVGKGLAGGRHHPVRVERRRQGGPRTTSAAAPHGGLLRTSRLGAAGRVATPLLHGMRQFMCEQFAASRRVGAQAVRGKVNIPTDGERLGTKRQCRAPRCSVIVQPHV